jgi:hypothetical protein
MRASELGGAAASNSLPFLELVSLKYTVVLVVGYFHCVFATGIVLNKSTLSF